MNNNLIARLLRYFFEFPQQGALVQEDSTEPAQEVKEKTMEETTTEKAASRIQAHVISDIQFRPTPNKGGPMEARYLIIHYTANGSVSQTVKQFQNDRTDVSAHLIVGRDGEVVQMVSFDRIAWHCGESAWAGISGLNRCTIGVEIVNWGPLKKQSGKFLTWSGQEVAAEEVVQLPHRNDKKMRYWQTYTVEQLEVVFNICREVFRHYQLLDVLGHDDISPGRKIDPGPAFPLRELREFCMAEEASFRDKDGKVIALKDKDGK